MVIIPQGTGLAPQAQVVSRSEKHYLAVSGTVESEAIPRVLLGGGGRIVVGDRQIGEGLLVCNVDVP